MSNSSNTNIIVSKAAIHLLSLSPQTISLLQTRHVDFRYEQTTFVLILIVDTADKYFATCCESSSLPPKDLIFQVKKMYVFSENESSLFIIGSDVQG